LATSRGEVRFLKNGILIILGVFTDRDEIIMLPPEARCLNTVPIPEHSQFEGKGAPMME